MPTLWQHSAAVKINVVKSCMVPRK